MTACACGHPVESHRLAFAYTPGNYPLPCSLCPCASLTFGAWPTTEPTSAGPWVDADPGDEHADPPPAAEGDGR